MIFMGKRYLIPKPIPLLNVIDVLWCCCRGSKIAYNFGAVR